MADITKFDPFRALERGNGLWGALDRLMADPFVRAGFDEGTLDVDVYQRDGKVCVEASVPGFKESEINLQLHDGVLSITAEHSEDTSKNETKDGASYYRRERRYGSMARRVALPGIIGDAPVEAELKNGVLKVEITAPADTQPKKIEIKTA